MAVAAPNSRNVLVGREHPRLAPPTPARSQIKDFQETAKGVGIKLLPWQTVVGRYLYASGPGGRWTWPEVAAIVARQNGKTELVTPHILHRLAMGRRILHTAQTRELPRKMFFRLIAIVETRYPDAKIRRGAGQETIELKNGGLYVISAATGGGPRGLSIDDLIVDELREIGEEFIGAAIPTTSASMNPQILYLSNAGRGRPEPRLPRMVRRPRSPHRRSRGMGRGEPVHRPLPDAARQPRPPVPQSQARRLPRSLRNGEPLPVGHHAPGAAR
jgi:hypothetical protein